MKASIYGTTAAALCLSAVSAHAMTALEAWDAFKDMSASIGQEVTAEAEDASGGTLTVTGVSMGFETPEVSSQMRIGRMTFSENGDGTVTLVFDETMALSSKDNSSFVPVNMDMTMSMPGNSTVVSDADAGVTFVSTVPEMEFRLDSMTVDGDVIPFNMIFALKDSVFEQVLQSDETLAFRATANGGFEARINGRDPDSDALMDMSMAMETMALEGSMSGNFMGLSEPAALRAALNDGGAIDYTGTFGPSAIAMNVVENGDTFQLSAELDGGTGGAVMNAGELGVVATYNGLSFTASGSEIPFPQVTGSAGELTTNFSLPMELGTPGQDFGMRIVLGDVVVGEEVWSLFDPAALFPRDPATVLMDLAGKATLLVDIFDEDSMMAADQPGLLETLTLNDMRVTLGGAELTGTGAFTFDNDAPSPFGPGMPAADGSVNLSLSGGNGLLDTLMNMGLIAQEQAMMARMMTGMLAKPGNGPDTLVSEISIRPDGTILANGAPLPF